jgi:hypothetical protein
VESKEADHQLIKSAVSPARFESHRSSNFDTDEKVLARYKWNVQLSEGLYHPLQVLEIVFRNALDSAIRAKNPNWMLHDPGWFQPQAKERWSKARATLTERSTRPLTHDRMVQELSFGFWTSLLNSKYESMFHSIGASVFPGMPSPTRKVALVRFESIRTLRNRIFHFRRIWNRPDLIKDHAEILEAMGWINPEACRLLLSANAAAEFAAIVALKP